MAGINAATGIPKSPRDEIAVQSKPAGCDSTCDAVASHREAISGGGGGPKELAKLHFRLDW
ncbi:unnamed protein product [Orchesella dallaii]|uniref:Uncharacterized protein n=1 Tax=Orchesella dallaii TaxID=48710 RepID=A0ABP1RU40_9HEXA